MTKTRYLELVNQCNEEIAWAVQHRDKAWEAAQKERLFWLRKNEKRVINTHQIPVSSQPQVGSSDSDTPLVVG